MGSLSKSKAYPCWVCSMKLMANSVLCALCSKWMLCRCSGVRMVTKNYSVEIGFLLG